MVKREPVAGPWSGLSVQSAALLHFAVSVVSWMMGV